MNPNMGFGVFLPEKPRPFSTMTIMELKIMIHPEQQGRIDVHIHFPLCDFSAFKSLASTYLGLKEHKLSPQVEEIFHGSVKNESSEGDSDDDWEGVENA
ncbi:hypothetical protein FF1_022375 [Malus domestica]